MPKTVTEALAEWVVGTRFEDVPEIGVARVRERFIDTLGVASAGMSVLMSARGAAANCW